MSLEILRLAIDRIVEYAHESGVDEIHLLWHGGEPLLAGTDFYKKALSVLEKRASGLSYRHFIQTNGLLLDDEYCRVFRDMHFEVGISLDGPAELHDSLRIDRGGKGTHAGVMKKLELLMRHEVPVGCCAVVTRLNRGNADELYAFFQDLGLGFRVNPVIPTWEGSRDYLLAKGEYGKFLCRLFDIWTTTKHGRVAVSPLDNYLRALLKGKSHECQHSASCIGFSIGIRPDGETVLCSRFDHPPLGNIRNMPIREIFSSELCRQISGRSAALNECRPCQYQTGCYGGCPLNAVAVNGEFMGKDPFCNDYLIIFKHILKALAANRETCTQEPAIL
jgi:uncharacterized protein